MVSGTAGIVGSAVVTAGSVSQLNPVGVALGATGFGLSSLHAKEGVSDLVSPYRDRTGERAEASLRGELPGLTGKTKAAASLVSTVLDLGVVAGFKKLTSVALREATISGKAGTAVAKTITPKETVGLPRAKVVGRVKEGSNTVKKIHKNSHEYVGDSHVYKIKDKTNNKIHKVGESSGGVRKRDGKSRRAEAQIRKLERHTGEKRFESEVIRNFGKKKEAYKYEEELIKRYRTTYKKSKDLLPGNKGNH